MDGNKKTIWFSTFGSNVFAVINTLWHYCSITNSFPDKFILYKLERDELEGKSAEILEWLDKFKKKFGKKGKKQEIEIVKLKSENIIEFASIVSEKFDQARSEDSQMIFDITSGRK